MVDNNVLLKELKDRLRKYYREDIDRVVLFGSRARGNFRRYSDFDVLIVLKKEYTSWDENLIFDLCFEMNLKYDILIDVHILSSKELKSKRGSQPIFINALKSGITA